MKRYTRESSKLHKSNSEKKKIISYLLFSSLCKKHSLTSDFCKSSPETKGSPHYNFPPFRPFLKYAKEYSSLQLLCVAMIASLKGCVQNTGVWEIPAHMQCALPSPLRVVFPWSLAALPSPPVVQESDAHKRKMPRYFGPKIQWLLSLPSLELCAGERSIQPSKVNSNWLGAANKGSDMPTETESIQQCLLHSRRSLWNWNSL